LNSLIPFQIALPWEATASLATQGRSSLDFSSARAKKRKEPKCKNIRLHKESIFFVILYLESDAKDRKYNGTVLSRV
jgi:hypothetical protein